MNTNNDFKILTLLSRIKNQIMRKWRYFISFYYRRSLHNYTFTIISNNCWGGFIYQRYGLPYYTPFIGLFIPAPCYIELLEHFDDYIKRPLVFITPKESKYYSRIKGVRGKIYPIALLGNTVEIHFLHEANEKTAMEHWTRRKGRINSKNMLVKFAEIDCCTPELIARFDVLPFKHKICFAVHPYPQYKSVVSFPDTKGSGETYEEWKYPLPNLTERLNALQKE